LEEHDKIRKDRDKKGEQGGTKQSIGNISVEQVTAVIGAMQKVPTTVTFSDESSATPASTQAENAFRGKEGAKKKRD
jgi:hypothetical protein